MNEEKVKYWEALEHMFSTDGWRQLVLDMRTEIYQIQADALEASDWDSVNLLKGRASALSYVSNLEEVVKMQRQMAEADEAESA